MRLILRERVMLLEVVYAWTQNDSLFEGHMRFRAEVDTM